MGLTCPTHDRLREFTKDRSKYLTRVDKLDGLTCPTRYPLESLLMMHACIGEVDCKLSSYTAVNRVKMDNIIPAPLHSGPAGKDKSTVLSPEVVGHFDYIPYGLVKRVSLIDNYSLSEDIYPSNNDGKSHQC